MDSARAGAHRVRQEGDEMPEHRIGTRGEWQARDELARLEAEQAERNEGDQEQASRSPLGPGREGIRVRQRGGKKTLATSSTGAHSCSPTTLCSAPATCSAPAPAAPAWATGSPARSST